MTNPFLTPKFPKQTELVNLDYGYCMHNKAASYNMLFGFDITGKFNQLTFNQAVQSQAKRYYHLNTRLQWNRTHPKLQYYAETQIPIQIFGHNSGVNFESLFNEELLYHFDVANEPLLRLLILLTDDNHFSVLFNMNHIIADGVGFFSVINDIFNAYNSLLNNQPPLTTPYPILNRMTTMLPPSLEGEQLTVRANPWLTLENEPQAPTPYTQRYTHQHRFRLSTEQTRRLIEKCKENRCSLFAATTTAAAKVMASLMAERYKIPLEQIEIPMTTPVNLRPIMPTPIAPYHMLNWLKGISQGLIYDNKRPFWEQAAQLKAALQAKIDQNAWDKESLIDCSIPIEQYVNSVQKVGPALIVTGLGEIERLVNNDHLHITLTRFHFSTTSSVAFGNEWNFWLGSATLQGALELYLNHVRPNTNEQLAARFAGKLKSLLNSSCMTQT